MHTRPLHPPVHRRHVRIMLGVLALVTWLLIAPIAYLDALGFWNSTEPVFIAAFVTALLFLPAVRSTCTRRGTWSALRRAQRGLHSLGMCVYFICMLLMIVIAGNFDSPAAGLVDSAFDLCFDGMVAGATLYFWSLLALPVLHGLARAELAWKQRGA